MSIASKWELPQYGSNLSYLSSMLALCKVIHPKYYRQCGIYSNIHIFFCMLQLTSMPKYDFFSLFYLATFLVWMLQCTETLSLLQTVSVLPWLPNQQKYKIHLSFYTTWDIWICLAPTNSLVTEYESLMEFEYLSSFTGGWYCKEAEGNTYLSSC